MSLKRISLCCNGPYRAARAKKCHDGTRLFKHQHPVGRAMAPAWVGWRTSTPARSAPLCMVRGGDIMTTSPPWLSREVKWYVSRYLETVLRGSTRWYDHLDLYPWSPDPGVVRHLKPFHPRLVSEPTVPVGDLRLGLRSYVSMVLPPLSCSHNRNWPLACGVDEWDPRAAHAPVGIIVTSWLR